MMRKNSGGSHARRIAFGITGLLVLVGLVRFTGNGGPRAIAAGLATYEADHGRFPRAKSRYVLQAGIPIRFSGVSLDALSIVSPPSVNNILLPSLGGVGQVSSSFDAHMALDQGIGAYDVPADITFAITGDDGGGGGGGGGLWPIEILTMDIVGNHPALGEIRLRESPVLASMGNFELTPHRGPPDWYQVDSFFDVFFELSIRGGPFIPADAAAHLRITSINVPEPTTVTLMMMGVAGVLAVARRRRS